MRNIFYKTLFTGTFAAFLLAFAGNISAQFADSALYNYTGGTATFTVPNCVTSITIKAWGAGGGGGGADGNPGGAGGGGAYSSSVLSVTSGQTFTISVGGGGGVGGSGVSGNEAGTPGYGYGSGGTGGTAGNYGTSGSGGGGGGGTFLLNGSTVIVAAGGGGGGGGAGNSGTPNATGPGGGGGGQNGFTLNYGAGGATGFTANYNGNSGTPRNSQDGGNAGAGGGGYRGGDVGAQPAPTLDGSGGGGGGGSSFGNTIVNGNAATPGYNTYATLPSGNAVGGIADGPYGTSFGGNGFLVIEYNLVITATTGTTSASCYGTADGTASAIATGLSPFTYSWGTSPVQTNSTATGLSAGTYTVTVYDVNGCSATGAATVAQPTQIQFSGTLTQTFSYTGAVQNWTIPFSITSATITATGASGANSSHSAGPGASFSAVFTSLTGGDNLSVAVGGIGNWNSNGGAGGGGATYIYDSNTVYLLMAGAGGGGGGKNVGGLPGGTDYVYNTTNEGDDGNGGNAGSGGNAGNSNSSYEGAGGAGWLSNGNNGYNSYGGGDMSSGFYGGAQDNNSDHNSGGYGGGGGGGLTGGGGGGGYNGGGGGNDNTFFFFNLVGGGGGGGGSYLDISGISGSTLSSNSGADGSASIEYTFDASPVTTQNAGCGSTGIITAGAPIGGTPPYSYNWTPSGGTDLVASNLSAGTYTFTVTDANNCSATASATVTGGSLRDSLVSVTNVSCYGGSNGAVTVGVSGGTTPYTYTWTPNVSSSATAINLGATFYTIVITDANGCTAQVEPGHLHQHITPYIAGIVATVSEPSQFTNVNAGVISEVTCNGSGNGHASCTPYGGTSPFTYAWSDGTTTVSTVQAPNTLSAGSFTVTVTDSCGASHTAAVTITQPNALSGTITAKTNITCGGGNGGSATAAGSGGTYPYRYNWSSGSTLATATGLTAGNYSVIITDLHSCSYTISGVAITQPSLILVSVASITYPTCNGEKGSATIGVTGGTGPYVYTWTSAISTTATANNMNATTYTVTIKDARRCAVQLTVTMTQPLAIHDTIVKALTQHVSCTGANNGSATVGAKYGTSPYQYIWFPNSCSTATATGLSAGTYSVSVQDSNGCSSTFASVTITQPAMPLTDSVSVLMGVGCYGGNGGKISIGTRGGSSPYTYAWSNGKSTYNISGLTAGTYSLSVTDHHGCSSPISGITVSQPAAALSSTIPTPTCGPAGHGTITISGNGGIPAYKFTWSNGSTSTSITVANGTYTVKETDANGCSATNRVVLACPDVLPQEKGDEAQQSPPCCGTLENINLYPNPNTGQFTLTGLENGMTVEMYDYTGRKISLQSVIRNSQFVINVSGQPNGIYLIRILDNTGSLVSQKKVVKTN